jgi:hypothetical protein
MEDIKNRLIKDLADMEWNDLIPHARRDALIVVNQNLNLIDVGVAIAQDEVLPVQHWISEQLIAKPSSAQLTNWNLNTTQKFRTLIVQPFVLIQEI